MRSISPSPARPVRCAGLRCVLPLLAGLVACAGLVRSAAAQPAPEDKAPAMRQKLAELEAGLAKLRRTQADRAAKDEPTLDPRWIADVAVHAKAAEWILRHDEFFKPNYADNTLRVLDAGLARLAELEAGAPNKAPSWTATIGSSTRGYVSEVDGSVQPYAISLPKGFDPQAPKRWPLHVVLHGRAPQMNEVDFLSKHAQKAPAADQDGIQLDVFGRTNNAYRWAGETDVFEALADVERRYRIDPLRIVLRGFSMGGAGSWHLGLHHPSRWCSVGPGAGFVDFYGYQKVDKPLPAWQDRTLRIYDTVRYALNAFDVPVVTYGGELDPQLLASTTMVRLARAVGSDIKLLVGPGTEHKFHPESYKEYMAFHRDQVEKGRARFPGLKHIRFTTSTPKYNRCEWLELDELDEMYEPAIVEGRIDPQTGDLKLRTRNVALLHVARDVAERIEIDGSPHPLREAADSLLPDVYYERTKDGWALLDYETSKTVSDNPDRNKRRDLQGPIDDAFMQPFVCVRGTGTPWNKEQADWANWTLDRFAREFDKHLRGRVLVVDDSAVTPELIASKNLILFGDPGSNAVLAKLVDRLPVEWSRESIRVNGTDYAPATHGLSLIFPNPLNPKRYVVVNSGHTFHADAFQASNAWLFPRLGDIAVQKFAKQPNGYAEETLWAENFNSGWKLPAGEKKAAGEAKP